LLLHSIAGGYELAELWANRLHDALQESSMPVFETYYYTNIARAKIGAGKLDEGQAILDQLLETLDPDAAWGHLIIAIVIFYGQLQLARGKPERVFDLFDERVAEYRQAGYLYFLPDELWLRGRAHLLLGQLDEAQAALVEARDVAEAREERAVLWQILATLSDLERSRGNLAASEKAHDNARAVIDQIAANAGELRSVFLGQPAVVDLLRDC
jgi:tetratricopeptide (TPR) repeat protein